MKNKGIIRKPNYCNKYNSPLMMLAIFMLALNFLIYNFYDKESLKNPVRIIALGIIFFVGIFHILGNDRKFSLLDILVIILSVWNLFINSILAMNVLVIIGCAYLVDIEYTSYIKCLNTINIILVGIVLLSLKLGIVQSEQYVSTLERTRSTLGFSNVNAASLFFFSANIVFIMEKKIKPYHVVLSVIYSIIICKFTDSRTVTYGLVVFFVMYYLKTYLNWKIIRYVVVFLITVLFMSVFLWKMVYIMFPQLDEILSFRVTLFSEAVARTSFKNFIFGGMQPSVGKPIDNFYILLLYQNGIFIYLCFYIFVVKALSIFDKYNLTKEFSLLVALLCIGLMESSLIRPEITCVMLTWKTVFSARTLLTNQSEDNMLKT